MNNLKKLFLVGFVLISSSLLNPCQGTDSLKIALTLHQSSQFDKALPVFIDLSNKFKRQNDIINYALCQVKIADMIRNYGGVNVSIEMLNNTEKLLRVRIEKPTLTLAENFLTKAEAFYTASRFAEFKSAVLQSILIKRQGGLPEKYLAEDYTQLARYYLAHQNQRDSCYYWINKALRLAKSDRLMHLYLLPRIYNAIGYYYHPASVAYFLNDINKCCWMIIIS